jgi:WhiB family redox-sensing transcriptional regulator
MTTTFRPDPHKPAWFEAAACRGRTDLFYAPDHEREEDRTARHERARAICRGCPVVDECLEFALSTNQRYGIWGALTSKQRFNLKRRRRRELRRTG